MTAPVRIENHGAVRLITIDRPAKMNSLDFDAHAALVEAFRAFDADDAARIAVGWTAGPGPIVATR